MASISKRSGAYQVRIRMKGYPTVTETFPLRSEAVKWAARVESEMRAGLWFSDENTVGQTMREALERYAEEVSRTKKGVRNELIRIRALQQDKISQFALSALRSKEIAEYRDRRLQKVSGPTVNRELALISNLFEVAIKEWGYDSLENPVKKVRRGKESSPRQRRLFDGEEEALLAACRCDNDRLMLVLALDTGCRRGELAALEWSDVREDTLVIRESKNGEVREVPLTARLRTLLAARRGKPGNLNSVLPNKVLGSAARTLSLRFVMIREKAGSHDLRFHDLRHEAASRLAEKGFSIPEISLVTGHKTWGQLQRYVHLKAKDLVDRMG